MVKQLTIKRMRRLVSMLLRQALKGVLRLGPFHEGLVGDGALIARHQEATAVVHAVI